MPLGRDGSGRLGVYAHGLSVADFDEQFNRGLNQITKLLTSALQDMPPIEMNAKGNVLSADDKLTAYAKGGLVNIPEVFSMPAIELTTGSSDAEAFTDGYQLTAYAKGGLVNAPTVFAMSDGLGLMGEAGTEAIMPLGRDGSGRLGVYAQGVSDATAPTVIVNVENQSGMPLTAQQGVTSFDEQFNRAVVQVILRDQATNGPISRNYRGAMR